MRNRQELFDLIGALGRRRYQVGEQAFSSLGLNHTEARLLTILDRESGEATQDALSSSLFVDRSNAGRALKGLEQRRYVSRHKDRGRQPNEPRSADGRRRRGRHRGRPAEKGTSSILLQRPHGGRGRRDRRPVGKGIRSRGPSATAGATRRSNQRTLSTPSRRGGGAHALPASPCVSGWTFWTQWT